MSRRIHAWRAICSGLLLFSFAASVCAQDRAGEFRNLAAQLIDRRLRGAEEPEAAQEQALALLDGIVLEMLNGPSPPALEAINQRLAELVTQRPPVGEGYELFPLGAESRPVYALSVNFGLAGPSAVRLYARRGDAEDAYRLAARIDRFTQPEYFDEYMELVRIAPSAGVFVTVTGRTDELQTGSFMAWRFDGRRLERLWATDLLERSSYAAGEGELRVTYCAEPDAEDPGRCARMVRDRFAWNGLWRRLEQTEVQP